MILWKMGWRDIRQRPGRAVLTLLSIVIGVASVVAITIAAATTRQAFDEMYQTVAGRAALEVTGAGASNFDAGVADSLQDVPGVKVAAPLIRRPTVMYAQHQRIKTLSMGIDPARDRLVRDYEVTSGKFVDQDRGVLLDADFAHHLGVKVNDEVKLLTRRGLVTTRLIGLFKSHGTAATIQGAVLLMPLRTAQNYFAMPGKIDSVQIVLQPGADEAAVKAEVARRLPKGLNVDRPAARSSLAKETAVSTEQGMNMARAFSLLVAVFIILNTFLINVTQRRRELGIMRAIGATRRQIAWLFYREALLMGAAGTVLGAAAGVVGAHYLTRAMGTLYQTVLPPIQLTAMPFVLAAVFGLGISWLGVLLPARKASRLSPMEAMRDVLPEDIEGVSGWFAGVGAGLALICGSVVAACIAGRLPMEHSVWASVFMLTGLVLLLPALLKPLSTVALAAMRPLLGVEARLARQQLLRHRARTTLTIGVLFVAASTGIGLASAVTDNVRDVKQWYRKTIVADFFVRAMAPDMATGLAADLPDELGQQIREKVPGITRIGTARFVSAKAAGEPIIVVVRNYGQGSEPQFDLESDLLRRVGERLLQGEVVMGSVLSERTRFKQGDEIPLETSEGVRKLRIAVVANDYLAGGLTMYMERGAAKRLLGVDGVDAYLIHVDHRRMAESRQALQELCNQHGLLLHSFSDIQHTIDTMMAGVVASLWSLVVLGFVVAAFGVANTLMMNVLEQTRELGLLRIVAMTRWQVRKTILAQALMMGIFALMPGIVAGVAVARLINLATLPVIGHPVEFLLHPWLLAGGFVVGLAIVVVAAWLPAERAARLELLQTLQFR